MFYIKENAAVLYQETGSVIYAELVELIVLSLSSAVCVRRVHSDTKSGKKKDTCYFLVCDYCITDNMYIYQHLDHTCR